MLLMLPSLGRAWEESEAVADSVPVLSRKGTGKLRNHLRNGASRTQYLEASNTEPAGTCSSMNTVSNECHDMAQEGVSIKGSQHQLANTFLLEFADPLRLHHHRHMHRLQIPVAHRSAHGTLFPLSVLTLTLHLRPNGHCHSVQARLCRKCCGLVIGLGPYLLSMTSLPSALVAVPGFSSFHFRFAPLISAPFAIRCW